MEPLNKYRISAFFCMLLTFSVILTCRVRMLGNELDLVGMFFVSMAIAMMYAYVLLRTGQSYQDTYTTSHLIHLLLSGAILAGWYQFGDGDELFVMQAWPIMMALLTVIMFINVTTPDSIKSRWVEKE